MFSKDNGTMFIWILVLAAVALFVLSLARERFEATSSIKAPPYTDTEKARIYSMLSTASAKTLMDKAKADLPGETSQPKLSAKAGGYITPALESFFTSVYKPGKTTINASTVDTFMKDRSGDLKSIESEAITAYFVNQSSAASSGYLDALAELGQSAGYTARDGSPNPVCPAGTIQRSEDNKCVSSTVNASPICSDGYRLDSTDKRCHRIGGTEVIDPTCPSGYEYNKSAMKCDTRPVDPTCPGGYTYKDGKCQASASSSGSSSGSNTTPPMPSGSEPLAPLPQSTPAPAAGSSSPATGPTAATTTGGSSTSSWGPTTGGSANRIRQVFGPQFTGTGGDLNGNQKPTDSSKTNVYPELLGGIMDTSSRIPGAGITEPSKNWKLTQDGSLPNSISMASDEKSRYFPYSRMPGDMDIIPDPYRVAQTFSASSYSSKTEPVPFLTDFSAFQK